MTTKTEKICPLLKTGFFANASDRANISTSCVRGKCAWWVNDLHTTEYRPCDGMCALVAIACTNSEGKIPV